MPITDRTAPPGPDLDTLADELARDILSEAFARYGRTTEACGTATRHVTRTTAIAPEHEETRSCEPPHS
jgi:hypothetical protein